MNQNVNKPGIAFIGAGNMATSIIGGLVGTGFSARNIIASDPQPESLARLQTAADVKVTTDNREAIATSRGAGFSS